MQIVNGYICANCTDVDYALKHIDPAHPKGDAQTNGVGGSGQGDGSRAVTFGGALAGLNDAPASGSTSSWNATRPGSALDLKA